ncbi:ABC transporter ATP-binding protein [Candidatus Viridilinea mediisalina]|uniref:ABC transporter n=1 Tax=Candidatus Viridilinea mediisalina TaxID=2024553 RepID=A0A2A6RPN9_9CHLR|nr:ABC transporter ATP-binding protein [Candidatus Viridilinea mediisalina]PDW04861.1 ABC transporter [Candidatus Viridilinea mediisalina]
MMMGSPGRALRQEAEKPKDVVATLRRFGTYVRPWWYLLVLTVLMIIVATVFQVGTAPLIGQAVDCYFLPRLDTCWYDPAAVVVAPEERLRGLAGLVLLMSGLFATGALLQGIAFFSMNWVGQQALRRIREDTFAQIQRLSVGYYTRNEAGNIMSRITSDTDTIQQALGFALLSVISGVLQLLVTGVLMLATNLTYALLSLSVVPVMILATLYFSTQARKAFRTSRQQMGNVNAGLQEGIAGMREVQAFNREAESIAQFRAANAANRDANVRAASFTSALNPVLEALGYVAIAIVVVVGGLSALRGQALLGSGVISLGMVFAFIQYVQRFNQPIQQIAVLWTNLQSAVAGGERIFGLIDTDPELLDRPDAYELPPINGRVVFDAVHAAYIADQPVLRGVSFVAEPGHMVAIVGPTGAGKTTIINLIPRFYDVAAGSVTIDGHDVRMVTAASLRRQIGIVLQDSFLFADTVMNNIRYGRIAASDAEVIAAAQLVAAHEFIERLPNGYQTVLGERGGGLSQGQRQLLAIARAALADPRILILDEATSSVDTRTERLIQRAFDQLLIGRTSFVIAHRLSTIRNANVVLVVQDGQIVERGTHDELLALEGAYYALYMSQFSHAEV